MFQKIEKMGGAGLIGISIVAGVLLLVGLVTPGWFGIDVKSGENDVSVRLFFIPSIGYLAESITILPTRVSCAYF